MLPRIFPCQPRASTLFCHAHALLCHRRAGHPQRSMAGTATPPHAGRDRVCHQHFTPDARCSDSCVTDQRANQSRLPLEPQPLATNCPRRVHYRIARRTYSESRIRYSCSGSPVPRHKIRGRINGKAPDAHESSIRSLSQTFSLHVAYAHDRPRSEQCHGGPCCQNAPGLRRSEGRTVEAQNRHL